MNKITRFSIVLAALVVAVQTAMATAPANYYNNATSKSDEALMTALRGIIRNHKELGYDALWNAFKTTDTDAQGYIIDMYSNCRYRPTEHGGSASNVGEGFNREHSFPKSWFNDGKPMYTDLFHLYPTDIRVNNQRSNYPFGVCGDNGTRLYYKEWYGKGKLGKSIYPGYSGTVFEPDDEYKGDFARTYFYMVTCYKNELPSWSGSAQLDYSTNKYKAFSTWSINMLMEWTRLDPVSEKETKRNDAVYGIQGNRNPFIDYPELAEYIWGNKQGEAWPGPGGSVTAGITSPVNGTTIDMGTTTVGTPLECTVTVKGTGLKIDLAMSAPDHQDFSVSKRVFTAEEVNNGTSFTITFAATEEGTASTVLTLGSEEASTTFTLTATANKQSDPPGPNPELGDSIMEDWEGCSTGGYWTKVIEGHTWNWDFVDAGIWGDNNSRDQLSCRLGKTSTSSITMREDVAGIGAIAIWAASFGTDADATLNVDFSTDKGASWTTLGTVTVTRGSLQHYTLDIDVKDNPVRFRIAQTAGSRANIDDITLYYRVDEPETLPGDVNGDGNVNVADVNQVINVILDGEAGSSSTAADVNGDGSVNIADINMIISIILK